MATQPRFNSAFLKGLGRGPTPLGQHAPAIPKISRRSFFGLGAAAGSLSALQSLFHAEEFAVVRDGARLHVLLHGQPHWTIDPAKFGIRARAELHHERNRIRLTLGHATFPGTTLSADFDCFLTKHAGTWSLRMLMSCGMEVSAALIPWLESKATASGRWLPGKHNPLQSFQLAFRDAPNVHFTRNWTWEVKGRARATVGGLPNDLHSDTVRMELMEGAGDSQIAAGAPTLRTLFHVERAGHLWRINLMRESEQGWSLSHDDRHDLFDVLRVEAAQGPTGPVHSALLTQTGDNSPVLRLFTGGGLLSDSGEPFHLALESPRLAFALNEPSVYSILIADLASTPVWAHGEHMSYQLTAAAEAPHAELIDGPDGAATPDLTAGLSEVCFPGDAVAMNLKLGVPKPFRITWADLAAPFERSAGILHLLPSQHLFDTHFDELPDHRLHIERPRDLLSLDFHFKNLRLVTGISPRILLRDKTRPGQITVIFPPQHVAEEAFFHNDDNAAPPNVPIGDIEVRRILGLAPDAAINNSQRNDAKRVLDGDVGQVAMNRDKQRPQTLLSGESQIVLEIPKGETAIPFHLENLLDWGRWQTRVADVARSKVDISDFDKIPVVTERAPENVTSIELPYQLMLSPSELGRWAHSQAPAQYGAEAVELWHTRLAVVAQDAAGAALSGSPDETNTKDRTVRAIWSPDYVAVDPSCVPVSNANMPPRSDSTPGGLRLPIHYTDDLAAPLYHDPFRMSLDSRDRCELVHLTTNYRIPKPAPDCVTRPTPDQILLPAPVTVEQMILTSMGGYLKSFGVWNPAKIDANHQLTVEQWRHIATLGRDHFVRVVYKGYLLPFGHRASLVKVTERKLVINPSYPADGWVAILHQRMFIVVQDPIKTYPTLGQPNGARPFPFRRVEALTLISPDIDLPQGPWPHNSGFQQTQSLFWPRVNGDAFRFRFRFTDVSSSVSEASLPVVFADAEVAQNETDAIAGQASGPFGPGNAIKLYNDGKNDLDPDGNDRWTTTPFSSQKIAFAPPDKPGDTQYNAAVVAFEALAADSGLTRKLYANDLPCFYPAIAYARVTSSSISRITGVDRPTRVFFYPPYIESGFDPAANSGEVILQVHDAQPLNLTFGGPRANVDKAGGLASPDTLVCGFSRKTGAVGGRPDVPSDNKPPSQALQPTLSLKTYSQGNFNAADFFGALTSAKILGAIRLADIIAPLAPGLSSNLEKAPRMLEQSVFAAEKVIQSAVNLIHALQNPTISIDGDNVSNPLARRLAPLAQRVFTLEQAVQTAHQTTHADENNSLLLLIDTAAEADLDRQLVGAIIDYGTALQAALDNPGALLEEALVATLTDKLQAALGQVHVEGQFHDLVEKLQLYLSDKVLNGQHTTLTQLVGGLEKFAQFAAEQTVTDVARLARDRLLDAAAKETTLLLNQYAPELLATMDIVTTAHDIQDRLRTLPQEFSLIGIPAFFADLNAILADFLTIYGAAGVLGILPNDPAVLAAIETAQTGVAELWRDIHYLQQLDVAAKKEIADTLDQLENDCIKLAAKASGSDLSTRVLQNLRQVQGAVASLESYRKQFDDWRANPVDWQNAPSGAPAQIALRLTQLLQQVQRQALVALVALQRMVRANELTAAATAANVILTDFEATVTKLASFLTTAKALVGAGANAGPIETLLTTSLNNPQISGALAGKFDTLQKQLVDVRKQLATDADDLNAQLLHYDLSIQLQGPWAAAAQWVTLRGLPTLQSDLDQLATACNQIQAAAAAITTQVGTAICALNPTWKTFVAALNAAQAGAGALDVPIYTLFEPSLSPVSKAFDHLCAEVHSAQPSSSRIIIDSKALFTAFDALAKDVSSRVNDLSKVPQLLVDRVVAYFKQQLLELLKAIPIPQSITLSYDWHPQLKSFEPVFLLESGADFVVSARATVPITSNQPPSVDILATLSNFSINLIGSPSFIIIHVGSLQFTSHNGSSPNCHLSIRSVEFGSAMSFVKSLAEALNPANGPFIELLDGAIRAGYRFAVDSIPAAGMTVMGLAIEVAVSLPFNGDPVRCEFGISDQQHPFLLSFGIYGGGGFLQLQLGLDGVQLLQGALEFGLVASVHIGPLTGEGFIVGGIYFRIARNDSEVCGFVHAHGHMDIFGIISLDVDLYVAVCYHNGTVTGTARFSVHVSILFFSETFELEATYTFAGSGGQGPDARRLDYFPPWGREGFSRVAMISDAHDGQGEMQQPVFIAKGEWEAYLTCFDL